MSLTILPQAVKQKNGLLILDFESRFEAWGMSSLVLLVVSGIAMAYNYGVRLENWFEFSSAVERVVSAKLLMLFLTLALAMSARFGAIPRLIRQPTKTNTMALHIILVTITGTAMLVMGSFIRFGGI